MNVLINKSNGVGVMASSICLVHCMATPFLFFAQACSASCCNTAPLWWQIVDYVFLVVSFFAVYHSSKTTSNTIIATCLWISWVGMFFVILNERIQLFYQSEYSLYIPALCLIILHLINRRYCHCDKDKCCANKV
ncbi:MAG: MerC domain-containing protein [Crocinitomicaceae bacterium]|nr:MerC domain-containing protein [Crocinitomicaceae bacterium]